MLGIVGSFKETMEILFQQRFMCVFYWQPIKINHEFCKPKATPVGQERSQSSSSQSSQIFPSPYHVQQQNLQGNHTNQQQNKQINRLRIGTDRPKPFLKVLRRHLGRPDAIRNGATKKKREEDAVSKPANGETLV